MPSGGALLVECLRAHRVALWTCVPGESFLPILDALYDFEKADEAAARLITARHEAAAANMAEAAGKLTRRAAVCLVTRGPGATQASIALHTAYQDGTPMILVVGQVERNHLGREAFQEMDFSAVFGSFTKAVTTIMEASRIPEHVARAVHLAHSGRPGPVVVVCPEDVLADQTSATPRTAPELGQPDLSANDARVVGEELSAAQHPLLVVGGPGWTQHIADRVRTFAERNEVPVVTAFRWQDAFDNASHAYGGYLGLGANPALRAATAEADLLVAFGPRLDDPTTNGYALSDSAARLVAIGESSEELGRTVVPHIAIRCGLASAAGMLADLQLRSRPDRSSWLRRLRKEQEAFSTPPATTEKVDLGSVIRQLRDQLPDNAVITNGAGNYTVWLQRYFEFRRFGTLVAPRNGAMGYGLPAGLAAAALDPQRPVVVLAGDGCFLMSGSELATAVRHHLNLVIVVFDNSMFGTIRMHQERNYPGRTIATDLHNPDFAAYAEAFGVRGFPVRTTQEFIPALTAALAHSGPALIAIRTDPRRLTPDLYLAEAGDRP